MGHLEGVHITPLKIIEGNSGNVLHVLKKNESTYSGFGEAYFSQVFHKEIKGWKKHREMILNLVVPVGRIRFVLFDDRKESSTFRQLQEIELSPANYQRLTVPPDIWMAFQGIGEKENLLLNIASITHNPDEADNLPLVNDVIPYKGFD